MAIAAHNVVVSVATGATAVFVVIDGIKSFDLSDGTDLLDVTDFASTRLRQRIVGLRDFSGSLDGDLELTDAGYLRVKAAYAASVPIHVRVLADGTNGLQLPLAIESIDRSGSVEGTVEVSISFSNEGSYDPLDVGLGM